MGAFQPLHLVVVAMVVLLVFGPKKLPELARGMGDAIKELKRSLPSRNETELSAAAVANAAGRAEIAAPPAEGGASAGTMTASY
jgi:sec-independent protein translocase protein TatA